MKACIVQPHYSTDYRDSDALFAWEMEMLDACDGSMDIIVFPEACDVPALARTREEYEASVAKYQAPLLQKARETAKRCNATLFINLSSRHPTGLRNTTYAIDPAGNEAGCYDKEHLTPGEESRMGKDAGYTYEHSEPTVIEIGGVRYGFLTCYDFYFYENFAHIARKGVDVIIGCSHQRSDTHRALEIITAFCAYQCNAYVLRSSVSMDETSDIGGGSMAVSPKGEVLVNMESRVGAVCVELDPHDKYYKPAGFGNPPAAHYEYIEQGRRPWKYRAAGSAIVLDDEKMPYPRICAHRGFNTVAPENSMPAFGAALAMGAEEIEFDLWSTKDGEIVSIHDPTLERVSTGIGKVWEHTYEELLQYDFGVKFSKEFRGLRILKFEEILKKFACHCIMNIHVKCETDNEEYDEATLDKIVALIDKYDCRRYVYFMSENDRFLSLAQRRVPDITRCCGNNENAPMEIVERAIRYGCKKVQLFMEYYNEAMIQKAHEHGIRCNYFYCDDPEQAKRMLAMGIDTVLTNDYQCVSDAIRNS